MTKYLYEILCWLVFAVCCCIAAVISLLTPWIGATLIVLIWAAALVMFEWKRLDVAKGFTMCALSPFIGTLFHNPAFGLGEYEWLIGIWVTAFIIGYFGGKELVKGVTSESIH